MKNPGLGPNLEFDDQKDGATAHILSEKGVDVSITETIPVTNGENGLVVKSGIELINDEILIPAKVDIRQEVIDAAVKTIKKTSGQVQAVINKYKTYKLPAIDAANYKIELAQVDVDCKSLKAFRIEAGKDAKDLKADAWAYVTAINSGLKEYETLIEPQETALEALHKQGTDALTKAENDKRNNRILSLTDVGFELAEGQYVCGDKALKYTDLMKVSDADINDLVEFGKKLIAEKEAKLAAEEKAKKELENLKAELDAREQAIIAKEIELGIRPKPEEPKPEEVKPETQTRPAVRVVAAKPPIGTTVADKSFVPASAPTNGSIPPPANLLANDANEEQEPETEDENYFHYPSFVGGFNQLRERLLGAIADKQFKEASDLVNWLNAAEPEVDL